MFGCSWSYFETQNDMWKSSTIKSADLWLIFIKDSDTGLAEKTP